MTLAEREMLRLCLLLAKNLTKRFPVKFSKIELLNKSASEYGLYFSDSKLIKIRLKDSEGSFISVEEIADTVAHELAHSIDLSHGKRFKVAYARLLSAAMRFL